MRRRPLPGQPVSGIPISWDTSRGLPIAIAHASRDEVLDAANRTIPTAESLEWGAKIVTPQPARPTSIDLAASIATMTARLRALSTAIPGCWHSCQVDMLNLGFFPLVVSSLDLRCPSR